MIGFLASCFVLASFIITGESKIRSVNIIGCILFVVYGLQINSIPVWGMNFVVMCVQIYYLRKFKLEEKAYARSSST